ncbi:DUF6580 family putative transport protein [Candidatus Pelagibacter sp. Uisw_134_02]|uniref:DUF6580 family putative transport protein n=1 Tax=Candidatus Pelagibacter sp. Uisw_134_02 TaxID=3230990 RepID=UPI0039EA6D30|tara:strand:+ start:20 stop:511 length:492 start_codon:yes stop_codon:yes gene_type:complete
MNYLKISLGIFLALAASRFIPHPPNFTSLIALSFYIPLIFGRKYIAAIIFSFLLTDLIIGFHSITFFTWGSVMIIGLIAKFFKKSILMRISGPLIGSLLFFIISNFGVWIQGVYGYSIEGLLTCYVMAIPFFHYTVISTIIFSIIIEVACSYSTVRVFKSNIK